MPGTGQVSPDGYWMWDGAQWVPNAARPVFVPPATRPYESAGDRATLTTVFLLGYIVGLAMVTVFDILDVIDLQQGQSNQSLDTAVGLVALLGSVAYYGSLVLSIVFFCMWVHRVVRNMPALGAPDPRWTPGGAVGRCFVPFLNFVHPLWSVLDAWRGASPAARWLDRNARSAQGTPGLIAGWWTAWLVAGLIGRISFVMSSSSDVSTQVAGSYIDIADNVLFAVAAVLAVLVVREVTQRQEAKNALIAGGRLV